MQISRSAPLVAFAMLAVGCSADRVEPPTRAPTRVAEPAPAVVPISPSGTISDLVRLARDQHPTVEAVRATRDAALARVRSARVWANPELEVQVGRTRASQGGTERDVPYGASLKQRLEWLGKRDARQRAAQAQVAVADADAVAVLNELEAEVRLAIIALGVAREEASQATADALLADQMRVAVEQGHAVGDRDTATLIRVQLEAATAQVRREASRRAVDTALAVLRLWCGEGVPETLAMAEVLPAEAPRLDPVQLAEAAQRDPRAAALVASIRSAEATAAAERSARIPDVTLGVFADRGNQEDTVGLSLGLELPVWNQNTGPIAEAEAHHRLATAELRRRQVAQRLALATALGDYESARAQAESLRTGVLPLAEKTLQLRTVGFTNGDLPLTDLLEARRALLATQAAALDARRRTAETLVRLGQVVGHYDLAATASSSSPTIISPESAP